MTPLLPQHGPQVHRLAPGPMSNPWVFFAAVTALVAVAAAGFFLALRLPMGMLGLHLCSTLPMIVAVGLFMTGFRFARSPREVVFGEQGLMIRSRSGERQWRWDEIAWADVQAQAMTNRSVLAIHGNDGRVLVKLPSNIERLDALAHAIKQRLTARPSPHAGAVRWRKSCRQAKGLTVATALALAGAGFMAWTTYDQRRTEELLRTRAVDGVGVVVRKFIAPDGRTHRIEYRVAGAGDDAKLHNVQIDRTFWAALDAGARVPVTTVPERPEISRLRIGEIEDESATSPLMNIVLTIAMLGMSALFFVGAILGFKGIDISTDKATGKLRIERLPKEVPAGSTVR